MRSPRRKAGALAGQVEGYREWLAQRGYTFLTVRTEATEQDWTAHTTTLLADLFPENPSQHETWPVCSDLAAHATTAVSHSADTADTAGPAQPD